MSKNILERRLNYYRKLAGLRIRGGVSKGCCIMIDGEKKGIRKNILAIRNTLAGDEIRSMSRRICARFTRLRVVENSSSMMIFLSFGSEVNTDYIIEWGWRHGKKILVPFCKPETRELIVSPIETFDDVAPGYFGIREPKRDFLKPVSKAEIGIVVVPAVAFDRRGYRIGYGGGYYDRFMAGVNAPKIGLAFSCQMIAGAPVGAYDLPVDGIVTEKEYIRVRGGVAKPTAGSFAC